MANDIVDDFFRRLLELRPRLEEAEVERLKWSLRQDWGGSEVYVRKASAAGKVSRLGAALAAGVPLRAAFDAAGCSRAGGYRLLRRRWRQ